MKTSVSMFSGGGLADIGLMAAGYTPVGACEHDPKIAAVYAQNLGPHIEVGDVRGVDPTRWAGATLLWASPPCQAHSVARSKNLPDREDADVGLDVLRWVQGIGPRHVVIENVPGYSKHPVFCALVVGLSIMGYGVRWDVVDAANFGVPQNRKRLILRADRDSILLPMLPAAVPWVGWYQAVEDLIPTFPESKFAPWQLARLPEEPCQAVTGAKHTSESLRAFLMESQNQTAARPYPGDTPCFTIAANIVRGGVPRAFLVGVNGGSLPHRAGAWLDSGRVVALTPRAIARLQTVPDWYALPETKTLAGVVLGNGVPCLLSQRIAEVI